MKKAPLRGLGSSGLRPLAAMLAALTLTTKAFADTPSVTGQTGLISMPDARFAAEGSWRTGLSFMRPYQAWWTSVTVFPWFEGSFRFTRIYHVPGFEPRPEDPDFGKGYGDFKDKSFDAKALIFPERGGWPALSVGVQDVGGGTGLFTAPYAAASKRLGDLDLTLGYGRQRIDGAFGGVRWFPGSSRWGLVAEYDAYDYPNDFRAELSGAANYKKEIAYGVEYRGDVIGAKAFMSHGEFGANVYLSIPLQMREFVPKLNEPAPYTKIHPRPTEEQWHGDAAHRQRLARALQEQDFRDIALGYENGRLEAMLTNVRISEMPRAVGRAARTMLSFAPLETREIRITYKQGPLPVATYEFVDARLLARYFNGMASREMLAPYVAIHYASPQEAREERDRAETLAAFEEPLPQGLVVDRDGADVFAFAGENVLGGRLRIRPTLSVFFNDPSGAYRYDVAAVARYERVIARNLFLQADTRLSLIENVSDVTTESTSLLPHVRSDVAKYKDGGPLKLTRLLVNRFYHPGERVYARASAGIYEEMFSGGGGQVLYLPQDGRWGADLAVDALRQRDFEGWFGHQDYKVLTAIASLNYKMGQGLTGTVRAGRFLAKDEGVRGEIKRRFNSGWEVGAWYTVTNRKDITTPGSPESPYYDKGVFLFMPLETMMTRDSQATASIGLRPWTRDVGQMVESPGDLWAMMERPVMQMHTRDGLVRLGDRDDDYDLPSLGSWRERRWPDFVGEDAASLRRAAGEVSWGRTALLGAGAVIASATFDKRADRYAEKHNQKSWARQGIRVGKALPFAALGLSGLFALDDSRPHLSDAGVAALEAGALSFVAAEGLKYAFGRARPTAGLGNHEFEPGSSQDRFKSFPSRHATIMWAAVTPYAKEYGMPWLYGVAALTNAARVGSREHWLSDTVGGAALGYVVGSLAWEARRDSRRGKNSPTLAVGPGEVQLRWDIE